MARSWARGMGGRSAVAACAAIAVLATMVAPVGAAHAQGDNGGVKSAFKWGASQFADPSDKVTAAANNAERQICDGSPHSLSCTFAIIFSIGIAIIFAALAVLGAYGLVRVLASLIP